jgi:hypothetical protein
MKKIRRIGALATLLASAVFAQDIAGDWRGTLKGGQAELRLVLHIVKGDGGLKATLDSIDQGANGIPVSSCTLKGTDLELTVEAVNGSYQGKVSADGGSIKGTWTQGQPLELNFERGTFKTADHKPGKPSDIDGAWSGKLDFGAQTLRIVFHIVNTEDGLTATADSPDQGAKGMPVTSVTRNGESLKFEMKAVAAAFDGKISADHATITGTFTQRGTDVPLVLTRVKDADPAK